MQVKHSVWDRRFASVRISGSYAALTVRGEARSRAEGSLAARTKAGSTPILSVWLPTPRPIMPRTHSENFQASYCPRLPVNHAELLKAISEETEKFFSLAPRSQVLLAVQSICRRYANLSEQCQAMIEGLTASGN